MNEAKRGGQQGIPISRRPPSNEIALIARANAEALLIQLDLNAIARKKQTGLTKTQRAAIAGAQKWLRSEDKFPPTESNAKSLINKMCWELGLIS